MKTTDSFKQTIQSFLENKAQTDSLFTDKFSNPAKNIDDCCTYILNQVQKSGCNGFADDEIFGMAIHYYDEENIEVGKPVKAKVVVNHTVELSAEEIKQAKEKEKQQIIDAAKHGADFENSPFKNSEDYYEQTFKNQSNEIQNRNRGCL